MRWTYRILRTLIVSLLSLAVGIPILLYVLLWLDPVRDRIRTSASEQLTELLGADVSIGSLEVEPFTRLKLGRVAIVCNGDTALTAASLTAGLSGRNLLRGRIVVTDVELMEPAVRVSRAEPGAPLSIRPVIDRLKGDGSKPPARFDLAVHTVVVRGGSAAYDVLSVPPRSGFDPSHIALAGLNADLTAPRISSDSIVVSLKRLAFRERSGIELRNLAADVRFANNILSVKGLKLQMPRTNLRFAPMSLDLKGERVGEVELLRGSVIAPADADLPVPPLMADARVELFCDSLSVKSLNVSAPDAELRLSARARAAMTAVSAPELDFGFHAAKVAEIVAALKPLPEKTRSLLARLGSVGFSGSASWKKPMDLAVAGVIDCEQGSAELDLSLARERIAGSIASPGFDVGALYPAAGVGHTRLTATVDIGRTDGSAVLTVDRVDWKERTFRNIAATVEYDGKYYRADVAADDSVAAFDLHAVASLADGDCYGGLHGEIQRLMPAEAGLWKKYPGHSLSARLSAHFAGPRLTEPTGRLEIDGLSFVDADGAGLREAPIIIESDFESEVQSLRLTSDLIDADVSGRIGIGGLLPAFRSMLAGVLPQYFSEPEVASPEVNDFTLSATVKESAPLFRFVKLPVVPLYPISIAGSVNSVDDRAAVELSAPYLQKGNSLISKTSVSAGIDSGKASAGARAVIPSKFGDMDLRLNGKLDSGLASAELDLSSSGAKEYGGRIALTGRPLVGGADVHLQQSELTFDDVRWTIDPAFIGVRGESVVVGGLNISRPGQELTVRGVASADSADRLDVKLDNINLDYVFSALRMAPTVQFGGQASGTVSGSGLLGAEPILQTNDLFVRDFSYGHCVMGDANVLALWNNETRGIEIHANVAGRAVDGSTVVDGVIYPLTEELDFRFNARHTPVGFLHTFMSTWASKVGGYASGNCHLFGDFKHVDLTGDFMAENFALTVGFTGVTYFATDSVHIRPGVINLDDILLRDQTGRTARLSGRLTHRFFQEPRFRFNISDLDRLLVLDTRPTGDDSRWYGTLRANGAVELTGVPGRVDISANVVSAPGGEFYFVLSDAASAAEYNFLTFRDATPADTSAVALPGSPELDRVMRDRVARSVADASASVFNFDLQADVTPDVKMTLVMDPAAGDKISGTGSGHIGILYGSGNDDMRLYGDYRIDKGTYNFSLQDIILKNFTIREGSEVAFNGDPMDARLDISAIYQVNANLSDLDESFLNDKEVQRTNVPVYAVLNVDGSLQDPQISFDLDFPTLTSDVKRKVRSIVSTDEMMNRQIIYLLALNRFYTPEYMSATKGNELVSVASGTISSQLSNILGQLSDKISVAPSVRSDAGDFSDVEFDVALSSTLLNNRLLLNGNFGYRDKSLNNNQFIGDFDVEYLLTRRGNWRLKAYNHFNDRNLYVKTALTTQGIGLVFKHDFDSLLRPRKKEKQEK